MKKQIFILIALSNILFASVFVCKGDNNLVTIKTDGDYAIEVNINGKKYDGIWKGSTVDDKGKPVKLHYIYGDDNIWIHSQDRFMKTTIRFYNGMDNMYLMPLSCKAK